MPSGFPAAVAGAPQRSEFAGAWRDEPDRTGTADRAIEAARCRPAPPCPNPARIRSRSDPRCCTLTRRARPRRRVPLGSRRAAVPEEPGFGVETALCRTEAPGLFGAGLSHRTGRDRAGAGHAVRRLARLAVRPLRKRVADAAGRAGIARDRQHGRTRDRQRPQHPDCAGRLLRPHRRQHRIVRPAGRRRRQAARHRHQPSRSRRRRNHREHRQRQREVAGRAAAGVARRRCPRAQVGNPRRLQRVLEPDLEAPGGGRHPAGDVRRRAEVSAVDRDPGRALLPHPARHADSAAVDRHDLRPQRGDRRALRPQQRIRRHDDPRHRRRDHPAGRGSGDRARRRTRRRRPHLVPAQLRTRPAGRFRSACRRACWTHRSIRRF